MTRSTSGARASVSPLPNALGMPNSAATAAEREAPGHVLHHVPHAARRAARRYRITPLQQRPRAGRRRSAAASPQPHDDTVPVSRPLQQQSFLPRTAAAAPRARRSVESDGVLAREGNEGVYATPLLGRAAAGRARHREREGEESRQSQREARAPGGVVIPRIARAAAVVSVCGARASTSPGGRGCGFRPLRSTQTSTIQPAAPSRGRSSRSTSKVRVIDLVPTRPTYVATRSRSSRRAGRENSL